MEKNENKNKYAAQESYQKSVGLISKSYKLKKSLVEDFAQACKKTKTSQAKVLTEFMESFIKNN